MKTSMQPQTALVPAVRAAFIATGLDHVDDTGQVCRRHDIYAEHRDCMTCCARGAMRYLLEAVDPANDCPDRGLPVGHGSRDAYDLVPLVRASVLAASLEHNDNTGSKCSRPELESDHDCCAICNARGAMRDLLEMIEH